MHVTSEQRLDDSVLERRFALGEVPGIVWTPAATGTPAPLVDRAVPEWRTVLDQLLLLPGLGGPVGFSGGIIAIAVRLALVEPRVRAAVLFAGSFVPRATYEEARQVTIPLQVLLQWDDEGNDRQAALDLFDAFGSPEKTLHANTGGHTGVPAFEGDAASRFFARHLRPGSSRGQR